MGLRLTGGGTATWIECAGDRGSNGTRERGKGEGTVQDVRDRYGAVPTVGGTLGVGEVTISGKGKGGRGVSMGDVKGLAFLRGGPNAERGDETEAGLRSLSELCIACCRTGSSNVMGAGQRLGFTSGDLHSLCHVAERAGRWMSERGKCWKKKRRNRIMVH